MTAKSFAKSFAKERRAVARCRGRASDCVNTVNIALFLTDINFWGENETRRGVIQDFFLLTNCLPFYSSALVTPRVNLLGTLLALSLYRFACRDTRNVKAIFAFLSALSAFLLLGKPELCKCLLRDTWLVKSLMPILGLSLFIVNRYLALFG